MANRVNQGPSFYGGTVKLDSVSLLEVPPISSGSHQSSDFDVLAAEGIKR